MELAAQQYDLMCEKHSICSSNLFIVHFAQTLRSSSAAHHRSCEAAKPTFFGCGFFGQVLESALRRQSQWPVSAALSTSQITQIFRIPKLSGKLWGEQHNRF